MTRNELEVTISLVLPAAARPTLTAYRDEHPELDATTLDLVTESCSRTAGPRSTRDPAQPPERRRKSPTHLLHSRPVSSASAVRAVCVRNSIAW